MGKTLTSFTKTWGYPIPRDFPKNHVRKKAITDKKKKWGYRNLLAINPLFGIFVGFKRACHLKKHSKRYDSTRKTFVAIRITLELSGLSTLNFIPDLLVWLGRLIHYAIYPNAHKYSRCR